MPTKEVLALLTDAPAAHLHEFYSKAAASIVEAYLVSGFPFLAIDPDRERGFRLPDDFDTDHFPAVVDVVFITRADLDAVEPAKSRAERRAVRAQGSAYFAGRPDEQKPSVALKSCTTRNPFGVAQAIIPPAARLIMNQVYSQQAQHTPERKIAEPYHDAVAQNWAELKRHAKVPDLHLDPLFAHIVSAWSADLPVLIDRDSQNHLVVPRGSIWTRFERDA